MYLCRRYLGLFCLMFAVLQPISASTVSLIATTNQLGPTPTILGYNSGHFVPGSNTRDWWHYSGVNGARVFITSSGIEPNDDIPPRGDGVTSQASLMSRKAAVRANPLSTTNINWPSFTNN